MVRQPMTALLTVLALLCQPPPDLDHFEITSKRDYQVSELAVDLTITAVDKDGKTIEGYCGPATVAGAIERKEGKLVPITSTGSFSNGVATLNGAHIEDEMVVTAGEVRGAFSPSSLRSIPGFLSILPPLFAIALAILLRQALIALFAGIWLGALFIHGYHPIEALIRTFDTYLPAMLTDSGHAAIIVFTMALGGMVGVLSRSGSTRALVDAISKKAKTRRSGMLTSWGAGLVVFFDDYANCMLVGNTLRPLTDRLKISREKLAYIVDSTAAPVATVAVVSTWIGYQVGLLDEIFEGNAYDLFLQLLPYSFYSFFTIAFVLMMSATARDFGPMLRAERRALAGEVLRPGATPLMDRDLTDLEPPHDTVPTWHPAVISITSVLAIVFVGLYVSGLQATDDPDAGIRDIIANADSYAVLLWASFGGGIIAVVTVVVTKALDFNQAFESWITGIKAMVVAVLILILAWGLGTICKDYLMTGPWVLDQFQPSPALVPVLTFFVCALIALATGSSFSTMAIVIPIAGPMAWALTSADPSLDPSTVESIRFGTLAAVLSGAVFGDHCSPISDTTIMSSMSAAADHVDHVRTQAPYAIVCASVAAVVGFVPAGYGISPWITLPLGIAILFCILRFVGKRAEDPA
jgi:Na+/H+ antiporter NhaC